MTKQREEAIIKEIKECGIRGEVHLTPVAIDTDALSFENTHINKERDHNVTHDEAVSYIRNAKISVTVWKGKFERYYGESGATYVDMEKKSIRTAYSARQFDDNVKKLMEVLDKHGR